jgi:iron complex transport system substrate-binding protein
VALLLGLALVACGATAEPPSPPPAPAAPPADRPQRIVSLNLCTDQLLMQLVERERIRAVSYLAHDPASSALAGQARLIPATIGVAEEVIALDPDLVLAGTFSTRATVSILRRLGFEVVEFDPEYGFADIAANIRKLAQAVGEVERGEAMVRAMEAELARIPPPLPGKPPVYADYNANGYTSGEGALITQVANVAGFRTLGQELGIVGTRAVALEQLLVAGPELIDIGEQGDDPALATEIYRHPALRRLFHEQASIALDRRDIECGSPLTLRAVRKLVAARQRLG